MLPRVSGRNYDQDPDRKIIGASSVITIELSYRWTTQPLIARLEGGMQRNHGKRLV